VACRHDATLSTERYAATLYWRFISSESIHSGRVFAGGGSTRAAPLPLAAEVRVSPPTTTTPAPLAAPWRLTSFATGVAPPVCIHPRATAYGRPAEARRRDLSFSCSPELSTLYSPNRPSCHHDRCFMRSWAEVRSSPPVAKWRGCGSVPLVHYGSTTLSLLPLDESICVSSAHPPTLTPVLSMCALTGKLRVALEASSAVHGPIGSPPPRNHSSG